MIIEDDEEIRNELNELVRKGYLMSTIVKFMK